MFYVLFYLLFSRYPLDCAEYKRELYYKPSVVCRITIVGIPTHFMTWIYIFSPVRTIICIKLRSPVEFVWLNDSLFHAKMESSTWIRASLTQLSWTQGHRYQIKILKLVPLQSAFDIWKVVPEYSYICSRWPHGNLHALHKLSMWFINWNICLAHMEIIVNTTDVFIYFYIQLFVSCAWL